MSDDRTVQALRLALDAEHAVIWGYGLVGGKVSDRTRPTVSQADTAHRARRDATVAAILARHGQPSSPEPSYAPPFPVTDEASALRLAAHLEEGAATAWHYVLGATTDPGLRGSAVGALTDAAVRATRWRARLAPADASVAFPGVTR